MKNVVVIFVLICALGMVALGYAHGEAAEPAQEYYAKTARVVEVNRATDEVSVEDSVGFLWTFYGCEDWEVGDCASLLMTNNGTLTIFDDEICGAQFNNWSLGK